MTRQAVMEAVEKLNYRVTVGDVAAQSGLSFATANSELMSLATASGGHLQVAESGDIAATSCSIALLNFRYRHGSSQFGNGCFT
jgi:hypothetical protein